MDLIITVSVGGVFIPSYLLCCVFQMAIIEYLEETKEGQSILPKDPVLRAQVSCCHCVVVKRKCHQYCSYVMFNIV